MNAASPSYYRYLNRGGRWLDFQTSGIALGKEGALHLATLPKLAANTSAPQTPAAPVGPAGIAVTPDGSVFWTNPSSSQLLRRDGCDQSVATVPCFSGPGGQAGQLNAPRGLLFHRVRKALFIADTGNHRLQICDPVTFQVLAIWGQPFWQDDPQPGTAAGSFNLPVALADDAAGNVYVVEEGNHRIQKFDVRGTVIPSFWETIQSHAARPQAPLAIAVDESSGSPLVFVLDSQGGAVFIYDAAGQSVSPGSFTIADPANDPVLPLGLAVAAGSMYVGDNAAFRIRKYQAIGAVADKGPFPPPTSGGVIIQAVGVGQDEIAVAGLALDGANNLLVVSDNGAPPLSLSTTGSYVAQGFIYGLAIQTPSGRSQQLQLLRARWHDLPAGTHAQLYFAAPAGTAAPPMPAASATSAPAAPTAPWDLITDSNNPQHTQNLITFLQPGGPAKCQGWVQVPLDAPETLFPGWAGGTVWFGLELLSDGTATPSVPQLRIDFDYQTYLQYLPDVYQSDPVSASFLARLLTLFGGQFTKVEEKIAGLAKFFDPAAAPVGQLAALGSLFGLTLPANWDVSQKRRAIRGAFAAAGRAGTAQELRQMLWEMLGVMAQIEEPIQQMAWWSLPDEGASDSVGGESGLGFTTRLAAVEAGGAVVGSTALLDQSQLLEATDFGTTLFSDVAHRFCVWVYARWSDAQTLTAIRALLDQSKPAHAVYQLGIVQPAMRIGFQARLGIDTVVAGPETTASGDLRLGGPRPGRVGMDCEVGITTRLGDGALSS